MPVDRDRPVLGSNFLVDFGDGRPTGFSEVVFPAFRLDGDAPASPPPAAGQGAPGPCSTLLLKRGVTGDLELYKRWNLARQGKAPRTGTLKVQLLSQDQETVVLTWTFHHARPVALSFSPLQAQAAEVVMETLELTFDRFELS